MHKALWLLPPLLGVAFYAVGAVTGSRDVLSAGGAGRVRDRAGMPGERIVPVGASAEEMERAVENVVAAESARIGSCDAEELKAILLQIMDRYDHEPGDAEERTDLWMFRNDTAERLGEVGQGAAWPWLLEHVPDAREEFMRGWAGVDPAGAFEAVVHSELQKPCSADTLGKLLQSFAAQGPSELREACRRAPWALFLDSPGSSSALEVRIDPESDVRPWIDSGVVPELQQRGVRCSLILDQWVEQYPRDVLAQWRAGSEQPDPELLKYMLAPNPFRSIERGEAIGTALSELPEEERARLLQETGLISDDPAFPALKDLYFDKDRDRKFFARPSQ